MFPRCVLSRVGLRVCIGDSPLRDVARACYVCFRRYWVCAFALPSRSSCVGFVPLLRRCVLMSSLHLCLAYASFRCWVCSIALLLRLHVAGVCEGLTSTSEIIIHIFEYNLYINVKCIENHWFYKQMNDLWSNVIEIQHGHLRTIGSRVWGSIFLNDRMHSRDALSTVFAS